MIQHFFIGFESLTFSQQFGLLFLIALYSFLFLCGAFILLSEE